MAATVLFLDAKSAHSGQIDHPTAVATAKQLIETIRAARRHNPRLAINTAVRLSDCPLSDNWSLSAALAHRAYQVEWDFLKDLAQRSPLTAGFESMLAGVASHEALTQGGVDSTALVCAWLMETGTAGLAGHADWKVPWIECQCTTLHDDSTTTTVAQHIRNASHSNHVGEHAEWLRTLGYDAQPTGATLWSERNDRFPGLRFLPRVRKDIVDIATSGAPYKQALDTLASLSKDVLAWQPGRALSYSTKVADGEHANRREYCVVNDEDGVAYYFDAHAYFTGGIAGRIHFRIDEANRRLVVAYVGFKLNGPINGN